MLHRAWQTFPKYVNVNILRQAARRIPERERVLIVESRAPNRRDLTGSLQRATAAKQY